MSGGDLHVHTTASDGLLTPAQVVERAAANGLAFLAVCDHNTLAGLAEAARAAPQGLAVINGVELSARPADGGELHLLGYGLDPGCAHLREVCAEVAECKHAQLREIISRLSEEGIDVDAESLLTDEQDGYTGRPALAAHLVEQGVVGSTGSAFWRFLGERAPTYVPMERYSPQRCIDAIRAADGLAVLAHPQTETIDRWLETLVGMGLQGVEVMRPRLSGTRQLYAEMAARQFGLVATGGSDWHGRDNEQPLGHFRVTAGEVDDFFTALQERCHQAVRLPGSQGNAR